MVKIGDKVIFDSQVDPDDAYLNGSIVKVVEMDNCIEDGFDDQMLLIEFDDGTTMDVDIHELKEIDGGE